MDEGARTVCTRCRTTIPLTRYWEEFDNPMTRRLWGLVPVVHASALFFFVGGGGWRRLIHGFKYRGAWRLARDMGRWYGSYLADCGLYDDVEVVVPVPLHLRKRLKRGYNQSEYLAEGIAAELGVGVAATTRRRRSAARATAGRMSKASSACGIPSGWPAAISCWWTMSSPRALRSSRAPRRSCGACPAAGSASRRSPCRNTNSASTDDRLPPRRPSGLLRNSPAIPSSASIPAPPCLRFRCGSGTAVERSAAVRISVVRRRCRRTGVELPHPRTGVADSPRPCGCGPLLTACALRDRLRQGVFETVSTAGLQVVPGRSGRGGTAPFFCGFFGNSAAAALFSRPESVLLGTETITTQWLKNTTPPRATARRSRR